MRINRSLLVGAGLLACVVAAPAIAGMWSNFPTVGGAARCASSNAATTTVPPPTTNCTTTVPAGPTIVTGNETIPGDTNLASGQSPQTVNIGMASLNALPVTFSTGSTTANNTPTATAATGGFIMVGSGALSPTTVTLPPSPIDGQQFTFSSNQNIATLSFAAAATPSGQTISNSPTALTVSTTGAYGYQFKYRSSSKIWYRMQ